MTGWRLTTLLVIFTFNLNAFAQGEEFMKEGEKLFSKGQYKESAVAYGKAIEADESNINAWIQRGMSYTLAKDYQKAVSDFNHVLNERPELNAVRNSRGSALMKLEKYQEASQDFNAILSSDPENQEAYNNRGWCKKHLGDDDGACDDWKKSKKLGNSEAKIILKNNGC